MKSLFIFLLCNLSVHSQSLNSLSGSIAGTVIEEESNQPVENVQIFIPFKNRGSVSRADGRFMLPNLPPGFYDVSVRMLGYETITYDSIHVQAGKIVELHPKLILKVYEVHEIQVTASRHEALEQSIPQLVSVVNQLKIRERNILQAPEILREEMGVFVQKTSNGGGSPIIRGLKANKILLLVDGIRMNNATYRGGNLQSLNTIDPGSIERMEVVHGPSSALYGSDALGGTINTITATPAFSQTGKLRYSGSFNMGISSADESNRINLQSSVSSKNWGLNLSSGWYGHGDVRRGTRGGDELMQRLESSPESGRILEKVQSPNSYNSQFSQIKLSFQPHYKHRFTIFYQLARQSKVPRYDVFERKAYSTYFYDPQDRDLAYLKYENHFKGPFADIMILTLSSHTQKEGHIRQKTGSLKTTVDRFSTTTRTWQLQFNKVFRKKHFLLYGAEFYNDKISASSSYRILDQNSITRGSTAPLYPDNSRYNSLGVYIQSEWNISNLWMLTSGFRYSVFDLEAPFGYEPPLQLGLVKRKTSALTGSISSRYQISESVSFISNIAQGFRAPNLDDVSKFGPGKGGTFYDIPNPQIASEKGISFDGGLKFTFENAKANIVFYHTKLYDVLSRESTFFNGLPYIIDETDTLAVYHKANVGKAFISGFEMSGEALLKWGILARANLSYAYGKNLSADEPFSAVPPLNGLASLRWNHPRFWVEMNSRFAMEQNRLSAEDMLDLRIPAGGTPGWFNLNFRSALNVGEKTKLQLAFMNVLDWNYREHLSGLNAPGRSVVLSGEIQLF
ncbi:MAG: TonB-dependent receptor [Calditrichaeota bacterium]|nr:MAG: TonB-dependent receptor [Calditrichota bacterium]